MPVNQEQSIFKKYYLLAENPHDIGNESTAVTVPSERQTLAERNFLITLGGMFSEKSTLKKEQKLYQKLGLKMWVGLLVWGALKRLESKSTRADESTPAQNKASAQLVAPHS
jgi:hypothetical protein